jgi:PAS domain S-box-containing protein
VAGRLVRVVNEPLEGGGWMATHEDVTERQRLLEAHEQSEKIVHEQKRQLDVALNNMTHGLCMFDTEGRIVLFNQRYSQLMGQSAESLRGLPLHDLFKHREATGAFRGDPDEFFAGVMASMREGRTVVREMVRDDGITLHVVVGA